MFVFQLTLIFVELKSYLKISTGKGFIILHDVKSLHRIKRNHFKADKKLLELQAPPLNKPLGPPLFTFWILISQLALIQTRT